MVAGAKRGLPFGKDRATIALAANTTLHANAAATMGKSVVPLGLDVEPLSHPKHVALDRQGAESSRWMAIFHGLQAVATIIRRGGVAVSSDALAGTSGAGPPMPPHGQSPHSPVFSAPLGENEPEGLSRTRKAQGGGRPWEMRGLDMFLKRPALP